MLLSFATASAVPTFGMLDLGFATPRIRVFRVVQPIRAMSMFVGRHVARVGVLGLGGT